MDNQSVQPTWERMTVTRTAVTFNPKTTWIMTGTMPPQRRHKSTHGGTAFGSELVQPKLFCLVIAYLHIAFHDERAQDIFIEIWMFGGAVWGNPAKARGD